MKWPVLTGFGLFFVLFACLFLYGLNSSLWVMWNLLPPSNSFAVALNQAYSQQNILNMIPTSSQLISNDIEAYMTLSSHLAWSHSDQEDVLILAPHIWRLMSVKSRLEHDGWQVEYVGAVLRATKPSLSEGEGMGGVNNLTQAISTALPDIFHYSYPLNPLFIAQSEPFSAVDQPILAIGSVLGQTINVDIQEGSNKEAIKNLKPLIHPAPQPEQVVLSASGSLLKQLPQDTRNALNEQLAQSFGFVKKQPDSMSFLSQQNQIILILNNKAVAVGVANNPAFIDTAHTWLQEEDRRYTIERRAFTLPDKTRGFEYVPASPKPVVAPDPTHPDCFKSTGLLTAYICTKDSYTIFTNNLDLLATVPITLPNESFGQIGQAWLQRLSLSKLQEVIIRSSSPWTHLEIKLSPK